MVDLGRLRFIDSAGVGFLDELASHRLTQGGSVHLHDAQPFVRKVIRLVDAAGARRSPGPAEARQDSGTRTRRTRTCHDTVDDENRWTLDMDADLLASLPPRSLDATPFGRR